MITVWFAAFMLVFVLLCLLVGAAIGFFAYHFGLKSGHRLTKGLEPVIATPKSPAVAPREEPEGRVDEGDPNARAVADALSRLNGR